MQSQEVLYQLCDVMVESGRRFSRKVSSKSPLMYSYYETQYLGTSVVHIDVEDFSEELLQCLLCHKEPARRIQSPSRGFLLAPRWFFMA